MFIIVVGCGPVGAALAQQLVLKGHEVTVIGQSLPELKNLPTDFKGRKLEGDVLSQDVLRRAEIEKAEGLVAITRSESLNAVIAHVASSIYHIPNVVVRNFDPSWQALHESLGYQVVSSAGWDVQRIENVLITSSTDILPPGENQRVTVFEIAIPEIWSGHEIEELFPSGEVQIVGFMRNGASVLPSDSIILKTGDLVYLKAGQKIIEALRKRLESIPER